MTSDPLDSPHDGTLSDPLICLRINHGTNDLELDVINGNRILCYAFNWICLCCRYVLRQKKKKQSIHPTMYASLPARDNCVRDTKTGIDSSSHEILHRHYLYDSYLVARCVSVDSMTSSVFIIIPSFYDGIRCVHYSWRAHTRYIRLERSRRFNHAFDWTFAHRETTSLRLYRSGETNQR